MRSITPYSPLAVELAPAVEGMLLDPTVGLLFLPRYQSFLYLATLLPIGDVRLDALLATHPVHRRAEYHFALQRLDTQPIPWSDSDELTAKQRFLIGFEFKTWHTATRRELGARGLLPDSAAGLVRPDGDHWRWHGPTPRSGEPATNIWGAKDVPVYRLLWLIYRDDMLPSDRRPVRIQGSGCYDLDTLACCNPWHFGLSRRTDRRRMPRTWTQRRHALGLTPEMVRWFMGTDGYLHCEAHPEHLLSSESLARYLQGQTLRTFLYCPGCHKIREQERRYAQAHPARTEPTEEQRQQAEGLMALVRARQEQAEREREQAERQQAEEQALRERLIKDLDRPI